MDNVRMQDEDGHFYFGKVIGRHHNFHVIQSEEFGEELRYEKEFDFIPNFWLE